MLGFKGEPMPPPPGSGSFLILRDPTAIIAIHMSQLSGALATLAFRGENGFSPRRLALTVWAHGCTMFYRGTLHREEGVCVM